MIAACTVETQRSAQTARSMVLEPAGTSGALQGPNSEVSFEDSSLVAPICICGDGQSARRIPPALPSSHTFGPSLPFSLIGYFLNTTEATDRPFMPFCSTASGIRLEAFAISTYEPRTSDNESRRSAALRVLRELLCNGFEHLARCLWLSEPRTTNHAALQRGGDATSRRVVRTWLRS